MLVLTVVPCLNRQQLRQRVHCVDEFAFLTANHRAIEVVRSVQTAMTIISQMRVSAFLELYLQVAGRDLTLR
jgi:hypothetical protein